MAKSNAERQRDYRQRAAEALRAVRALADANPGDEAAGLTSLPRVIFERTCNDPEDEDAVRLAQTGTAQRMATILDALHVRLEELDELPNGYVTLLGGREYVETVLDWIEQVRRARGARKARLEQKAPTVPGEEERDDV